MSSDRDQVNNAPVFQVVSCTRSAIVHISFHFIWCPTTSNPVMNWLKNRPTSSVHLLFGFDVDANSAMGKSCAGRRGSVAKTCSAVPGSRHPSIVADRAGLVATSLLKKRLNRVHTFAGTPGSSSQPEGLNGRVRQKAWGMWRHHELHPLSRGNHPQRGKSQDERKEVRDYHDQPKSRTDCRGGLYQGERGRCLSEMRPRTSCSTPLRDRSCAAVDGISPEHRVL